LSPFPRKGFYTLLEATKYFILRHLNEEGWHAGGTPREFKEVKVNKYFSFAIADSMFSGEMTIVRREVSVEEVKVIVAQGVESCCNPSHQATIDAMRSRYGIKVAIPVSPPRVELHTGDSMVVMGVRGLPRLTDRHEYTKEEIAQATFSFAEYTAQPSPMEIIERIIQKGSFRNTLLDIVGVMGGDVGKLSEVSRQKLRQCVFGDDYSPKEETVQAYKDAWKALK